MGTITAIHTRDFDYKGHARRASEDEPQYGSRATGPTMSPPTRAGR